MTFIAGLIVGVIAGGLVGVVLMSLLVMAGQDDEGGPRL